MLTSLLTSFSFNA